MHKYFKRCVALFDLKYFQFEYTILRFVEESVFYIKTQASTDCLICLFVRKCSNIKESGTLPWSKYTHTTHKCVRKSLIFLEIILILGTYHGKGSSIMSKFIFMIKSTKNIFILLFFYCLSKDIQRCRAGNPSKWTENSRISSKKSIHT